MKRKAPSSSRLLVNNKASSSSFKIHDLLPEMIHEINSHLDPCSVECFRITCKKFLALMPVSPLDTRNKDDFPGRQHVVLATAALRFSIKVLKKVKTSDSFPFLDTILYYYAQNPNHCQWTEMAGHLLAIQKRRLPQWELPLICGLIYSRNDRLINFGGAIVGELYTNKKIYMTCMRQVLARPDVVEFVTSQREMGITLWDCREYNSFNLLKNKTNYDCNFEPRHFVDKVARGYFELLVNDPVFRSSVENDLLPPLHCPLGKFNAYKSAKLCCTILEHLRSVFNFEGTFAGSPYDLMQNCVNKWDATTLKQCISLGFWKIHLAYSRGFTETSLHIYSDSKGTDPDRFEDTWNLLVEHHLLKINVREKKECFEYAIDAQQHWSPLVFLRYKQLLKRHSEVIPGADYMLKVVEAVESVPNGIEEEQDKNMEVSQSDVTPFYGSSIDSDVDHVYSSDSEDSLNDEIFG